MNLCFDIVCRCVSSLVFVLNKKFGEIMQEEFRIGVISNTHGIKGELKVFVTTDEPNRYKKLKQVRLVNKKSSTTVEIERVRFFKNMVIIKLKGYDDINQVEAFKGSELMVDRENAIELDKNEFYIADAIGCDVILPDSSVLGKVKDVIQTGANDVFVVNSDKYGEVLIPSIKSCIKNIDIENLRIYVELMDGILPEDNK